MPVRVIIADDHTVMRQGVRMLLTLDPDIEVVGEAGNGQEAVELARRLQPDVVLMDLLMPVMDGLTAITLIRRDL
ncbi:MAG: response regulator transcription factor, partial [Anaerolineales bacterium]|nr:response regulator transcription factor [Anaerolineales bacterium]